MEFLDKYKNVSVIDTMMFSFDHYMSAYLIEGRELAIVDTGLPNQTPAVISSIREHGYSPSDISYIFVTHCEHPDHAGNVAPLLEMAPKAKVYINPVGLQWLTEPEIEDLKMILELPIEVSYHGHYGIVENPKKHIIRTLDRMQKMIDIGTHCMEKGAPEEIAPIINAMNKKEAEKLPSIRGRDLYEYVVQEHIPPQAKSFAELFIQWYESKSVK
jgi:mRNA degradation ribonuclease J1/J2